LVELALRAGLQPQARKPPKRPSRRGAERAAHDRHSQWSGHRTARETCPCSSLRPGRGRGDGETVAFVRAAKARPAAPDKQAFSPLLDLDAGQPRRVRPCSPAHPPCTRVRNLRRDEGCAEPRSAPATPACHRRGVGDHAAMVIGRCPKGQHVRVTLAAIGSAHAASSVQRGRELRLGWRLRRDLCSSSGPLPGLEFAAASPLRGRSRTCRGRSSHHFHAR
jgi:hypothetical protein